MTQEKIKQYIHYNPDTGEVIKLSTGFKRKTSASINALSTFKIDGTAYSVPKLLWLYIYGILPSKDILIIDGDNTNLKLTNLYQIGYYNNLPLTQDIVKNYLNYNPTTGLLTWKAKVTKYTQIGATAGFIVGSLPDQGYLMVDLFGKRYPAHRLIWMYLYGSFPDKQIDHINHNRADNRISNLRLASHHTNMKNKTLYITNTSGQTGVEPHGANWKARIGVNGTKVLLGVFKTFDEAVAARKAAEKLLDYHNNHGLTKA